MEKLMDLNNEDAEVVDFFDVAQGLKCWKQCKSSYRKEVFAGYVKVKVEISNKSNQLLERYRKFLIELFGTESVFAEDRTIESFCNYCGTRAYVFTIIVGDVSTKEDTEDLLDDCIILNTYSNYFERKTGFRKIHIVCGMVRYDSWFEMSLNCKKDIVEKQVPFIGNLVVDELVKINTIAEKELKNRISGTGFYPYNFAFTDLGENLKKFV